MYKVGDYVSRKKYKNDIVFKIIKINKDICYLKGINYRLFADAKIDDLEIDNNYKKKEYKKSIRLSNTDNYFYIPGKILHIDSDIDYLKECLKYYKINDLKCVGFVYNPVNYNEIIIDLLIKYKPDIVVITGHDSYNKKENKYKNSNYYIKTVKTIREYNKDIIIISGACQSDYYGLIKAGSTFASSPKHKNISALDPAVIATYLALSDKFNKINLENLLEKTECGSGGIGGINTYGTMIIGYPRKDNK